MTRNPLKSGEPTRRVTLRLAKSDHAALFTASDGAPGVLARELVLDGLARAAAPRPEILLADEPTGNLDSTNGQSIMELLFDLRDRHGSTLVLVTHDEGLADRCDRIIQLRDGKIAA